MDYGALTAARLRSGQWLHWGIRFFLAAALTGQRNGGWLRALCAGVHRSGRTGGRWCRRAGRRRDGGAAVSALSAGIGLCRRGNPDGHGGHRLSGHGFFSVRGSCRVLAAGMGAGRRGNLRLSGP